MKAFRDISANGNEKAIRRGKTVPQDDVNLAYIKAPELSPKENLVIIDTARLIEENVAGAGKGCNIYYANPMGVLVDENDNSVIVDEFPIVGDVFSVEEDNSDLPGSEYRKEHILPFRHVSRYFHKDYSGITDGDERKRVRTQNIKVVDSNGVEYNNYAIEIYPAQIDSIAEEHLGRGLWAYRVHAYVDTDEREDLYLQYNRVEIDTDGSFYNDEASYQELINAEPYFSYVPEESDVVDPVNKNQRIFSSKPVSYKDRILGKIGTSSDGFRIHVPKKALPDPRIYQPFRWRVTCTFKKDNTVDPSRDANVVNCGVLVTSTEQSGGHTIRAPWVFKRLMDSNFNINNLKFLNPEKSSHSSAVQATRDYWEVNMDTGDFSKFDILIWASNVPLIDASPYIGKLNDFANNGGTLIIDTSGNADYGTSLGGQMGKPVFYRTGTEKYAGNGSTSPDATVDLAQYQIVNTSSPFWDGDSELGGWDIKQSDLQIPSLSSITTIPNYNGFPNAYCHAFDTDPVGYTALITAPLKDAAGSKTVVMYKKVGLGHIVLSTIGIPYNTQMDYSGTGQSKGSVSNESYNGGEPANYLSHINSSSVEGAMKFIYNAALLGVSGKIINDRDEFAFSTTWSHSTDWSSSWVINASNNVLSSLEKSENNFVLKQEEEGSEDPKSVWKRKLSNRTFKQLIDDEISRLGPEVQDRVKNTTRTYKIENTNPFVETDKFVFEDGFPYAWTEAYTPSFQIPADFGPYIFKEEVDAKGNRGRAAKYDDTLTYNKVYYPDKPYSAKVQATYVESEEFAQPITFTYSYDIIYEITEKDVITTPGFTKTEAFEGDLNWVTSNREVYGPNIGNRTSGGGAYVNNGLKHPEYDIYVPSNFWIYQMENYHTGNASLCWPNPGINTRIKKGDKSEFTKYLQYALNSCIGSNLFPAPHGKLAIDSIFGPKTDATVRSFQGTFKALNQDGVVDVETWFLLATQLQRLRKAGKLPPFNELDHTRFAGRIDRINYERASDGTTAGSWFSKRSNTEGGPSSIWEQFAFKLNKVYDRVMGINITGKYEGTTLAPAVLKKIYVGKSASLPNPNNPLLNFKASSPPSGLHVVNVNIQLPHSQNVYVPVGPFEGDFISFVVSQSNSSGIGSSRYIGIAEMNVRLQHDADEVPPTYTIVDGDVSRTTVTVTRTATVSSLKDEVVNLTAAPPNGNIPGTPTGAHLTRFIGWENLQVNSPDVSGTLDAAAATATFRTQSVQTNLTTKVTQGPNLNGGAYYGMSTTGRINPVRENGWVNATEGIKLLVNAAGKPYGFPALPTDMANANDVQRHFSTITLTSTGSAPSVQVGLYDKKQQEFIRDAQGNARISFIEYVTRGPQNIYVAVLTDFNSSKEELIPVDKDAPPLPFRWAMPVYGVCTRDGASIALQPLPANLGPNDLWPIAVRQGQFTRLQKLRETSEYVISGYLGAYQGTVVEAFYTLAEADDVGWSLKYGPPNTDILAEEPAIIDEDLIRVRHVPILNARFPTKYLDDADPYRPVVTVYTRPTINDAWTPLKRSQIKDINTSTGEIYLKSKLASTDPSLIKVDYTARRRSYLFKKDNSTILNLNAYSGHTKEFFGKPIYVYILPRYVKDSNGNIIADSVQDKVLRITLDPAIFDPRDSEYNPLAIQLGIIYQTASLDVRDVSVLDTRRRGGGVVDSLDASEVGGLISDTSTYWDIGYGAGASYQKAGFVIIRLPQELRDQFTKQEIDDIIKRNITAGVDFRVESLDGTLWEVLEQ